MKHRLTDRGFSTISFAAASAMLLIAGTATIYGVSQSHNAQFTYQRKFVADTFASEALEFFASMTTLELNTFLLTDPITGNIGTTYYYPLCERINELKRQTNAVPLPDPAMDLPISLLNVGGAELSPSRFYQVRVVSLSSGNPNISVNASACGTVPYELNPISERFMVTVGVNWVPVGLKVAAAEETLVSTIIADLGAPSPPPPTVDITANGQQGPIDILMGVPLTIAWTSANTNACTITPTGWTGVNGSQVIASLNSSSTYTATCTNAAGDTATDQVTITVHDPCNPIDPKGLITFETIAGVTPALSTRISNQFKATHGVVFNLCMPTNGCAFSATPPADCVIMTGVNAGIPNSLPYMAEINGPAQEAYRCDNVLGGCSQEYDGTRGVNTMGRFFITDEPNNCPKGLVIDYDNPVDQASFGIMDIDGGEKWQIKAYNSAGTQVGSTINLHYGNSTYDGKETRVAIDRAGASDISRIVLVPYNWATFGLGFDNFSPSKVCP